jgi:hypothetical protein
MKAANIIPFPEQPKEDRPYYVAVDFAFCSPAPTKQAAIRQARELLSAMNREGFFIDASPARVTCIS